MYLERIAHVGYRLLFNTGRVLNNNLCLGSDEEKDNEKSRQNYAEENDEECSEIH